MYIEKPNVETKEFYEMFDASNIPIYDGCRDGHYLLSLSARVMTPKNTWRKKI